MSSEKQKKKQRKILNLISRQEFSGKNDAVDVVMDDETYIDLNWHDFSGNKFYFSSGISPSKMKENTKRRLNSNIIKGNLEYNDVNGNVPHTPSSWDPYSRPYSDIFSFIQWKCTTINVF